jgi:hypothetical protein
MLVRRPYRSVCHSALVILLAIANLFVAGPGLPRTPAKTQRTVRLEPESSAKAIFSRTGLRTIGHHSRPQTQNVLATAALPAHWSAALLEGWYRLPGVAGRSFGDHVPSGSGRSPPLFLL